MHYTDCRAPMIVCHNCGKEFDLNEAPGAAIILPDGQFVGRCPYCGHEHEAKQKEKLA